MDMAIYISSHSVDKTYFQKTGSRLTRIYALTILILILSGLFSCPLKAQENLSTPLGIGLDGPSPWGADFFYINLAHQAMEWKPSASRGWSNELPATDIDQSTGYLLPHKRGDLPVIWDRSTSYSGEFILTWEGGSDALLTPHDSIGNRNTIVIKERTPGKIVFSTTGSHYLFLQVTNGADPVKNIKIIESRFKDSPDLFYPHIYKLWSKFKVIRYMVPMSDDKRLVTIRDFKRSSTLRMKVMTPEYIAHLSNRVGFDTWINIPHLADDSLVRHIAVEMKKYLNPSLRLYIEYSNEVWNTMFAQHQYAVDMANLTPEWDNVNPYQKPAKWYGRRCKQIFDIFENVYGSTEKLVRVVTWNAGSAAWIQEPMLYTDNLYRQVDLWAVSYYFGYLLGNPQYANPVDRSLLVTDLNDLFSKIPTHMESIKKATIRDYTDLKKNPDFKHIELAAYEGGQHLVSYAVDGAERDHQTNIFMQANRDPRMKDIYLKMFRDWKEIGGKLFAIFHTISPYGKHGSYGQLEYSTSTRAESPKYDADLTWIEENPVTWSGKTFTWGGSTLPEPTQPTEPITSAIHQRPVVASLPRTITLQRTNSLITISDEEREITAVELFNVHGNRLLVTHNSFYPLTSIDLNIQSLTAGVYVLKITTPLKSYTAQFKKH